MRWILLISCLFLMTGCNEKEITPNQEEPTYPKETIKEENMDLENPNIDSSTENNMSVTQKEEQMITYTESLEQEVMTLLNSEKSETIKEKIADKFITIVDFIYYDASINGIYFKDLTESAQAKIKEIARRIDGAIESKIPDYKSTLKEKYQTALAYVKDKAGVISDKAQEKIEDTIGSENYQNFVDAKDDMKDSFQNAVEVISDGASHIYQSGKDKVSNWYQGLKEKYDK